MHGWSYGYYGWQEILLVTILLSGITIGIIFLIIWLVRNIFSKQDQNKNRNYIQEEPLNALDILKIRYARGEIDREKYLEILNDIS